jgi:cytochrome c
MQEKRHWRYTPPVAADKFNHNKKGRSSEMKRKVLVMVLVGLLVAGAAFAAEKGTAKEAKAMVQKAIAYYKANGQDTAFAEFNNPRGKFVDGDLYIWVGTLNAKVIAHGANKALIGKDLYNLKDPDGKQFMKEIVDVAKAKGSGWVDYKWSNPVSKKIEHKSVYLQKVDDKVFVCGFYK